MTPLAYRLLIAGSRDWPTPRIVWTALNSALLEALTSRRRLVVVHGKCRRGPDADTHTWVQLANQYADTVTEETYPAEDFGPWPACGPIRNDHMTSLGADHCYAFIAPCTSNRCRRPQPHPSHGATGCARDAERAGIPVTRWTSSTARGAAAA